MLLQTRGKALHGDRDFCHFCRGDMLEECERANVIRTP